MTSNGFPTFFPSQIDRITSKSALDFARRYQRRPIYLPTLDRTIDTAHVPPIGGKKSGPPVCFLHGYDSSSFDFRKVIPHVEASCETWAVDLVGWGFSDHRLYQEEPGLECSPGVKRDHLYQFWKTCIGRPMCLMGVSLGGAVAVDFAVAHPEAVDGLVLSGSQGYVDGLGMLPYLPEVVKKLGVRVLQTAWLRRYANTVAYYDQTLDLEQIMLIGQLHTFLPGWIEATMSFIRSGGYSVSKSIPCVDVPTMILWGAQDKILGTDAAERFHSDIRNSELHRIDDCGHAGHIEKYAAMGDQLLKFLKTRQAMKIKT